MNDSPYPVELTVTLKDAEYLISLLEESSDDYENMLADEIRTQVYA